MLYYHKSATKWAFWDKYLTSCKPSVPRSTRRLIGPLQNWREHSTAGRFIIGSGHRRRAKTPQTP